MTQRSAAWSGWIYVDFDSLFDKIPRWDSCSPSGRVKGSQGKRRCVSGLTSVFFKSGGFVELWN